MVQRGETEVKIAEGTTAIGEVTGIGQVKVRTSCQECSLPRGVVVYLSNGRVVSVEGDPESAVHGYGG